MLSLAVDCLHSVRMLLLLAGDVEADPGPSQDLLQPIARYIKEIKKDQRSAIKWFSNINQRISLFELSVEELRNSTKKRRRSRRKLWVETR